MTTKQILISTLLLSTISTIGLTMQQDQEVKPFNKGWHTDLNNNTCCNFLMSITLQDICNENNDIKIIEIIDNKKVPQGTIGSFKNKFNTFVREKKDVTFLKFLMRIYINDALFDPNNQTIFYGNKTDINNYHNKIKLLDEKLEPKKTQLRFNKKFVERACKEEYQCKNLKAEIEKTEKEINQLYQNL